MTPFLKLRSRATRALPFLLLLLLLAPACKNLRQNTPATDRLETTPRQETERTEDLLPTPKSEERSEEGSTATEAPIPSTWTLPQDAAQDTLEIRGAEDFLGEPPPQRPRQPIWVEDGEEGVLLKFEDTDLLAVTRTILGDILEKDYLIDSPISGTVSLSTERRMKREALLPLLEKLLVANGGALLEQDGLYRVSGSERAARDAARAPITQIPGESGYRTMVVPLRQVAVEEMQRLLQPFLPPNSLLQIDPKRNLLILAGNPAQLEALLDTIRLFDVSWLKGMSMGLVRLQYVDPQVLLADLERALEGSGGRFLNGLARIAPIKRLNALLIVTSKPALIDEFNTWIRRLDVTGRQTEPRLFVYQVQNSKASDLAALLGEILRRDPGLTPPPPTLAPGLNPVRIESPLAENPQEGAGPPPPGAIPPTPPATPGEGVTLPIGRNEIRILADEVHNSLLILATPRDYRIVESALTRLDTMPLQVLIEARILEVSLDDELRYGVEWFFKNSVGGKTGQGLLDLNNAGADIGQIGGTTPALGDLRLATPGFSYALLRSAADVRVLFKALASESRINMLASPSLMVLDNQTANINIGNRIPVPSRQSVSTVSGSSPLVNEINYQDTGVILNVTPRINANGLVTMKVTQEVSNAVSTRVANIDAPTIQQRKIESVVAVYSGQTVVLGGLIQEARRENYSGIPWLMDIPLLGNLFRSSGYETDRSELIILITPRAVSNQQEALQITEEFRSRLREFQLDTQNPLPRRNQADPLLLPP